MWAIEKNVSLNNNFLTGSLTLKEASSDNRIKFDLRNVPMSFDTRVEREIELNGTKYTFRLSYAPGTKALSVNIFSGEHRLCATDYRQGTMSKMEIFKVPVYMNICDLFVIGELAYNLFF